MMKKLLVYHYFLNMLCVTVEYVLEKFFASPFTRDAH